MKIMIVTDAAPPQVNGVVITLTTLGHELGSLGHTVHCVTPASFRTIPCPTYPEIRLALFPGAGVRRALDALKPDAIHIATEGPLGIAARRYCMRHKLPFTTSYHTRFPEYVRARVPLPISLTYAWLRAFHGRAARVMVPSASIQQELKARGFRNTVIWPRGVDVEMFRPQGLSAPSDAVPVDGRPVFAYVGRVAVEKNLRAFLDLELPGSKWVIGGGPQLDELRRAYPATHFLRRGRARGTACLLPRRRCVRVSQPHRYLRPGIARIAGLRGAGGGLSGARPARCDWCKWSGRA